jgi:hypothetical protein
LGAIALELPPGDAAHTTATETLANPNPAPMESKERLESRPSLVDLLTEQPIGDGN